MPNKDNANIDLIKDLFYRYDEGYYRSISAMIDSLNMGKAEYNINVLVFPLMFLMRHSIELRLKHLIFKCKDQIDHTNTHSFMEVWNEAQSAWEEFLASQPEHVQKRNRNISANKEAVDTFCANNYFEKSDFFRYPYDLKGKPFLQDKVKDNKINIIRAFSNYKTAYNHISGLIREVTHIKVTEKTNDSELELENKN